VSKAVCICLKKRTCSKAGNNFTNAVKPYELKRKWQVCGSVVRRSSWFASPRCCQIITHAHLPLSLTFIFVLPVCSCALCRYPSPAVTNASVSPSEEVVLLSLDNNNMFVLGIANVELLKADEMTFEPLATPSHHGSITGLDVCQVLQLHTPLSRVCVHGTGP
jgi:hypothetical protein